jgi:hypothetical protein
MYKIARIESLLTSAQETLTNYEALLKSDPDSLFNRGMVKNTIEHISELRSNLVFEKKKREKEIIDLRLKGHLARLGTLPLDLLGQFTKSLSDCIVEASRKIAYGNRATPKVLDHIKNTIDLRFDRLIPGSTHILITGQTAPDLFGNSTIEDALKNTFNILNSENGDELFVQSEKYGGKGVKKIDHLLSLSIKNKLEFDLEWTSPGNANFKWEGTSSKINQLHSSLAQISIDDPEEIEFNGILHMQSLKGQLEVREEGNKSMVMLFPLAMLDNIRQIQIGDACHGIAVKTILSNKVTGQEKVSYELKDIGLNDAYPVNTLF